MGVFKVTFAFVSGATGWSESYFTQKGNGITAAATARALAKTRIRLCGVGVDLPHIRVSDLDIRGDAVLDGLPGYTTIKTPFRGLTYIQEAEPVATSDVAWTAAIVTYSLQNVAIARTFMRGLPDEFFMNDRIFVPSTAWKQGFDAFKAEIKNGINSWGVNRKAKSTPTNTVPVAVAVFDVNGNLSVAVDAAVASPVGSFVAIRGLKTSAGNLSGRFKVLTNNGVSMTLKVGIKSGIPVWDGKSGTMQNADLTFITGLDATFDREATSRHAGRPFGSLVGRRKRVLQLR